MFKITASGSLAILHSFGDGSVANDAEYLNNSLTIGSDGTLYGASDGGGVSNDGTVFKMTPAGAVTVLHSFAGGDGEYPAAAVTIGTDGKLYGSATGSTSGSTAEYGTIFNLKTDGSSYLVQFRFNSGNEATVGQEPYGTLALVPGSTSNQMYGTCFGGGSAREGTLFEFRAHTTDGSGTVTLIHAFGDGTVTNDGQNPYYGRLQTDSSGNIYGDLLGTTTNGGEYAGSSAYGVIYKLAAGLPNPVTVSSVSISPSSVQGGSANATGTVKLAKPAPTAGATISLSSANSSVASVPSSVHINANGTSATFTVTSHAVSSNSSVTISASYNGSVKSAGITVTPAPAGATLSSVYISPTSTTGGTSTTANRAYLSGNATADTTVTLSSSNTAVATVPSSVLIKAGSSSHTFTITTKSVTSSQTVTITAKANGVTKTDTVTVTPAGPSLQSVVLSPTSLTGGASSTASRAYLTADATSDVTVNITSSNTSVATITTPTVTIKTGSSSHVFTVQTSKVTSNKTVTITATANGVSKTATLTVTP